MTSQPSAPVLHIASNATTVHFHFNSQDSSAINNNSTVQSSNVTPLPNLTQSSLVSRFGEILEERRDRDVHQTRSEPSNVNRVLHLFRNILNDNVGAVEIPTSMPRTTTPQTTSPQPQTVQPPIFQPVVSRSVNIRDMLQRLRLQTGQTDTPTPIAVSFEVLSSTEEQNSGLSIQELNEHTTLGLYEDIIGDNESEDQTDQSTQSVVNCSICHESLHSRSIIRQVDRCGHIFHHECIEKWLSENRKCPLCMQHVIREEDEPPPTNNNDTHEHTQSSREERIFNLVASELGI